MEQDRQTWLSLVEELTRQVEGWAKNRNWPVHRDHKQIQETVIGSYTVPVLNILTPSGTVQLDPVARSIANADGRVDLIAWPSLTRMLLVHIGNAWILKTDSGIEWPERWSQNTFEKLVETLSAAA